MVWKWGAAMAVSFPVAGRWRRQHSAYGGVAPAVRSTEGGATKLTVGRELVWQPRRRLDDASEHLLLHARKHRFPASDGGGRHARKRAESLV